MSSFAQATWQFRTSPATWTPPTSSGPELSRWDANICRPTELVCKTSGSRRYQKSPRAVRPHRDASSRGVEDHMSQFSFSPLAAPERNVEKNKPSNRFMGNWRPSPGVSHPPKSRGQTRALFFFSFVRCIFGYTAQTATFGFPVPCATVDDEPGLLCGVCSVRNVLHGGTAALAGMCWIRSGTQAAVLCQVLFIMEPLTKLFVSCVTVKQTDRGRISLIMWDWFQLQA